MKRNFDSYKVAKTVFYILTTLLLILSAWMFVSWVDIISDNLSSNPQIEPWNFFELVLNMIR